MAKHIPIYHITHVDNLKTVVDDGFLWCDKIIRKKRPEHTNIGYKHIKERRLQHPVRVSKRGCLGDYVPFNFCYRSVMLYVLHKGHKEYSQGQDSIIHLVSSIERILKTGQPYFWTNCHGDLGYANQFDTLEEIDHKLDLSVMPLKKWNLDEIKEKRQAEFLVHERCPWSAIEKIVVKISIVAEKVEKIIQNSVHQPQVLIDSSWYY